MIPMHEINIAPDSLEVALHEMAKATLVETAEFDIKAYCPDCKKEMLLNHPTVQCPNCYSINIKFARPAAVM
jgi:Zn finger protein HypA/HybF involved in hydrogenase expression